VVLASPAGRWLKVNRTLCEVVVAYENITKRKEAENAMQAGDEKFRQFADNITDVF
jgi:hypothetical protein